MSEVNFDALFETVQAAIAGAASSEALEAVRVEFLGRNGTIASLGKEMKNLKAEEKAAVGKKLNALKNGIEQEFETRRSAFAKAELDARLASACQRHPAHHEPPG